MGFDSAEYWAACLLRDALLRAPLSLDLFEEALGDEAGFDHLVALDPDGRVVGCLQLVPLDDRSLKMRQVAVSEGLRRQGVGRELVARSEERARELGAGAVVLHAREDACPFYEALGYRREGERFTEVGLPHFRMVKPMA